MEDNESIALGISETPYNEVRFLKRNVSTSKVDFSKIVLNSRMVLEKNNLIVGSAKSEGFNIMEGQRNVAEKMTIINTGYLLDMTDPYDSTTRDDFALIVLNDPIGAPSGRKRRDALFEDGLECFLEKNEPDYTSQTYASGENKTKTELISEGNYEDNTNTKEQNYSNANPDYILAYKKIKSWIMSKDINLLHKMRIDSIASISQGRALTLIVPPIAELEPDKLPENLKTISYEDIKSPIIDRVTWKMIALRVQIYEKMLALPDEYIYTIRNDDGLRRDSAYYGTSEFEPIVTISRGIKRAFNHDMMKALVSAYMQKIILEVMTRGSVAEQTTQMQNIADALLSKKNDIILLNAGTKAIPIPVSVDMSTIDMVVKHLDDAMITNIGVTKSMMMREFGLNRDLATVQEIAFIKYTRKPDEIIMAESYENQLLNPLMAHLLNVPVDELEWKFKIKIADTKELETKDVNPQEVTVTDGMDKNKESQQNLTNQKIADIGTGDLQSKEIPLPLAGSSNEMMIIARERIQTDKELIEGLKRLI